MVDADVGLKQHTWMLWVLKRYYCTVHLPSINFQGTLGTFVRFQGGTRLSGWK